MLDRLLPSNILSLVNRYNLADLQEIRLRRHAPIVICIRGENRLLLGSGGEKIFAAPSDIEFVLKRATENSLYAYNGQIKQGFITAAGGIRLGIAGESVNSDNFMPTTIKNISAINIRIPHEVKNCSSLVYKFIVSNGQVKNTLIISPPGAGKTTLLRDISRKLSDESKIMSVLLVDERFELAACDMGNPSLDVGAYTDIVSGANKNFAFSNGIRSLKADVIITDELMGEEDAIACKNAMNSGVKVIASIHGNNHIEVLEKPEFSKLLNGQYFERIVVLSKRSGVGTCEAIYDEKLNCIYF